MSFVFCFYFFCFLRHHVWWIVAMMLLIKVNHDIRLGNQSSACVSSFASLHLNKCSGFFCLFLFFFFFLSFIRACVKKLIFGSHYRKFCFSFTNVKSYSVDLWVKLKLVPKKGLTNKKLDMFLFFENLNESWRDQNIRLKFVGFLGFLNGTLVNTPPDWGPVQGVPGPTADVGSSPVTTDWLNVRRWMWKPL